jgi:hypothetical protein
MSEPSAVGQEGAAFVAGAMATIIRSIDPILLPQHRFTPAAVMRPLAEDPGYDRDPIRLFSVYPGTVAAGEGGRDGDALAIAQTFVVEVRYRLSPDARMPSVQTIWGDDLALVLSKLTTQLTWPDAPTVCGVRAAGSPLPDFRGQDTYLCRADYVVTHVMRLEE